MGSRVGILKIAAGRIGISIGQYTANRTNGLKWCYKCKNWKPQAQFGIDKNRGDGLAAVCFTCRRVAVRKRRKDQAPSQKVANQATNAIRYAVKCGRMVKATELPCHDCGKPAQVYHHHLGYARRHWLDVIPLCKSCHTKRHWE